MEVLESSRGAAKRVLHLAQRRGTFVELPQHIPGSLLGNFCAGCSDASLKKRGGKGARYQGTDLEGRGESGGRTGAEEGIERNIVWLGVHDR